MNLYKQLLNILPSPRIDVGQVVQVYTDGALVMLQTGGYLRAIGSSTVGTTVYVKGGQIIGEAPDLSGSVIEI